MSVVSKVKEVFSKGKKPAVPMAIVAPSEAFLAFGSLYKKAFANPDKVLQYESRGENYELYMDMLRKYMHLAAVLHNRFQTVGSLEWAVMPYDEEDSTAVAQAEFVDAKLKSFTRLTQCLRQLIYGVYFGFSVSEIAWQVDFDNTIGIGDILSRHQNRFEFAADGTLLLKDQYGSEGVPVPDNKFIVLQNNIMGESPYGNPLAQGLYWLYLWWLFALKHGNVALEKFGMPTVDAIFKGNLEDKARRDLENQLDSIQASTNIIHNESVELSLLEKAQRGETPHWPAARYIDKATSVAVLGQSLTTTEGEGSGSYALGKQHGQVQEDILQSDALLLMSTLNKQLITPLVMFNFGAQDRYPLFVLRYEPDADLGALAERYKILTGLGMPITQRQVREQFTIEEVEGDEPILSSSMSPIMGFPDDVDDEQDKDKNKGKDDDKEPSKSKPETESAVEQSKVVTLKTGKRVRPPRGSKEYRLGGKILAEEKFRKQLLRIYGNLNDILAHEFVNNPDGIADMLNDIVEKEFYKKLGSPMTAAVEASIRESARAMAEQLKMTFNKKLFTSITKNYLKRHAYKKGTIEGIRNTLREILSGKLDDVLKSGGTLDEMVTALRSEIVGMSESKALQIAVTETRSAANFATLEMGRRSKLDLEAWFVGDGESCLICMEWSSRNPYTIEAAQRALYPHPSCNCQWVLTLKKRK